ncbi:MAG: ribosomal protein l4 [Chloroflexota bacterium]|jgi:large subunit ribosomal protein L4
MATVDVFSKAGAKVGSVELPPAFSSPVNESLIHQAVISQLAGRRTGTHASKKRGAVAGGGRKPWRQKGTGRARQGSTRSPQWKGGGVVFGPQVRSHEIPFPKRMRRAALLGALSAKVETLKVVDAIGIEVPKTKAIAGMCTALKAGRRVLVVAPVVDSALVKSVANIPNVSALRADSLNVVDLVNADTIIVEQAALATIQEVYG